MTVWHCFLKGWTSAAALWPVVLLLYLVDTVLALVLAIPPAAQLARVFGHSAMAPDLVGPVTLDLLIEAWGEGDALTLLWPIYLLVPLLFVLAGTFLRGGTLGALAAGPRPLRWGDFFADCARFFRRLLVLLLFFVPGLVVVGLLFVVANLLLGLIPASGQVGWALAALRGALLPFLLFLLLMAMDYARLSLVLHPGLPLPRHAGRGLWFLVRRFPRVVLLGLGFVLAGALIAALYPGLLWLSPLFGALVPALVVQQITALLASLQRVAALGGEMELYRAGRGTG